MNPDLAEQAVPDHTAIVDNMLTLRAAITTTDELIGNWTSR